MGNRPFNCKIWTLCMVQDGEKVLLLDRQHDDFKGFIPPGGKVDFPESPVQGAIREVYEETGLQVEHLIYKGLYEYVNPVINERCIIFNYLTKEFSGKLKDDDSEGGRAVWVNIADLETIPMQKSIRRRLPFFFEERTFEIHVRWGEGEEQVSIVRT